MGILIVNASENNEPRMLKNFTVRTNAHFPVGTDIVDPDDHVSTPGRGVLAFSIKVNGATFYVPAYLQEIEVFQKEGVDLVEAIYAAKFFWDSGEIEMPKFSAMLGWYHRMESDPEFVPIMAIGLDGLVRKDEQSV